MGIDRDKLLCPHIEGITSTGTTGDAEDLTLSAGKSPANLFSADTEQLSRACIRKYTNDTRVVTLRNVDILPIMKQSKSFFLFYTKHLDSSFHRKP